MKQCMMRKYKHQRGLTLVELMIGLVLGLIVVSAVFNTYLGSTRSARFSQGLQQMQENGRYGVATLQRGLRLAGYSAGGDLLPFDIAASDVDTVVVQTQGLYDCNGASTVSVGGIAVNTYTHDDVNDTITCTGNASATPTAMPIVEGVEAMRFLWGIDADSDGVPEQYQPYNIGIDPAQVVSMRVAILVNSGEPIRSRASEETHVLLDVEVDSEIDKIARNVFTSTVLLRNR